MNELIIFSSILAVLMTAFIAEKRSLGFNYQTEEMILKRFDQYCIEKNLQTLNVTKEFLEDWCMRSPTEGLSNQHKRISTVRQLLLYMMSLGIAVYIPACNERRETVLPHIFSADEIKCLFETIDSYELEARTTTTRRLAREYRVLFRMLYCCGLRNSEGSGLPTDQINLLDGTITVLNSKGNKDRVVYMSEDLSELCSVYYKYLRSELGGDPKWFFPASDPERPLKNTNVDAVFNRMWARTPFAAHCNNKPTVHDLRFTYVTDRINSWVMQGIDVDLMMPYLQKYLGHSNLQDSYYYYHTSEQLYDAVWQKDKTSHDVIPEVMDYEQE